MMRMLINRELGKKDPLSRFGSVAIEYAVVLAMITVVLFSTLQQLSQKMNLTFALLAKELQQAEEMTAMPYEPPQIQQPTPCSLSF